MQRLKPDVDVVLDILTLAQAARPDSPFLLSLLQQYRERGGLSKKQLQGLYDKAKKTGVIPEGKLATLEAIILKKHTKHRSELPENKPLFEKDGQQGRLLADILSRYPEHKRVLFLQAKFTDNVPLTLAEVTELQKFHKLLVK